MLGECLDSVPHLAVGGHFRETRIFRVSDGELIRCFPSHYTLQMLPLRLNDRTYLAQPSFAPQSPCLRFYCPDRSCEIALSRSPTLVGGAFRSIAEISLSHAHLLAAASHDSTIRFWNIFDSEKLLLERTILPYRSLELVRTEFPVNCLAASSSRCWLAASLQSSGDLRFWDVNTGQVVRNFRRGVHGGFTSTKMMFGPKMLPLLVSASGASRGECRGSVEFLSMVDLCPAISLRVPRRVHSLYLTNDSLVVLCGDSAGRVSVWDLRWPSESVKRYRVHSGTVHDIVGVGNGMVATCSSDGSIKWGKPGESPRKIVEFRLPEGAEPPVCRTLCCFRGSGGKKQGIVKTFLTSVLGNAIQGEEERIGLVLSNPKLLRDRLILQHGTTGKITTIRVSFGLMGMEGRRQDEGIEKTIILPPEDAGKIDAETLLRLVISGKYGSKKVGIALLDSHRSYIRLFRQLGLKQHADALRKDSRKRIRGEVNLQNLLDVVRQIQTTIHGNSERYSPTVTIVTDDGARIAAHLEILLIRSVFLSKMLSFGGAEAEAWASSGELRLCNASESVVRGLVKLFYTIYTIDEGLDAFSLFEIWVWLRVHEGVGAFSRIVRRAIHARTVDLSRFEFRSLILSLRGHLHDEELIRENFVPFWAAYYESMDVAEISDLVEKAIGLERNTIMSDRIESLQQQLDEIRTQRAESVDVMTRQLGDLRELNTGLSFSRTRVVASVPDDDSEAEEIEEEGGEEEESDSE